MTLLATVVGALLTAVLGNRLVQHWQQRNWRHQQQFLGLEKDYAALRALTDEIVRDCGSRLTSMRELNSALLRGDFQTELSKYRDTISSWNGSIHSHYAQLTFQLKWDYATHLEHCVHDRFVSAGKVLEREVRSQNSGQPPDPRRCSAARDALDAISGEVADFSRSLVRATEERRQEVFYGRKLTYCKSDIPRLSNIDLIKLLFESDIDGFSVVRPTADVSSPLGRRL